jgi:hypothetical protein
MACSVKLLCLEPKFLTQNHLNLYCPHHQSSLLFPKIAEVEATKSKDHGSITNFSLAKLAACERFQAYHFLTKFTNSHISHDFSS